MSNATALNQAQREQFKNQLTDLRSSARRAVQEKSAEAHQSALLKVLEQQGGSEIAERYRAAKEAMDQAENELESKGFSITSYGVIELSGRAPEAVKESYEAFVSEQIGADRERLSKLDEAISSSWSIATLSEAKQVLASFAQ